MRKVVGLIALSLACSARSGAADTLLTYVREAPEMVFDGRVTGGGRPSIPGRARPRPHRRAEARYDPARGPGKALFRRQPAGTEAPEQSARLRVESGRRQVPRVRPEHLRGPFPREAPRRAARRNLPGDRRVRAAPGAPGAHGGPAADEKDGSWQAAEHRIELVDPAGHVRAAATVWTTAELPGKTFAPLQQLQEAVAAMNPRPERLRLAQEIDKLPGVPVRVESTFDELAGTVTRSLELGAIQEKAATAADYEPPKETFRRDFLMFYGSAYHDL